MDNSCGLRHLKMWKDLSSQDFKSTGYRWKFSLGHTLLILIPSIQNYKKQSTTPSQKKNLATPLFCKTEKEVWILINAVMHQGSQTTTIREMDMHLYA